MNNLYKEEIEDYTRYYSRFDKLCNETSNCRQENDIVSCCTCDDYKCCDLQNRVDNAKDNMNSVSLPSTIKVQIMEDVRNGS